MPSPDAIDHADIIAGVERAIVRLLTAPDTDGAFYDAVRQRHSRCNLGDRGSIRC